MSKNGSTKKINPIWVVLAIIIAVGALFCLTTYIYGKCTNQSFVEVLTNKTETEDKTEDKGDESESTDENQDAVEDEQSNVQTTSYLNLEDNIIFIQQ